MPASKNETIAEASNSRRCFVVSAFGADPDEQTRTKQVLRHLVRKVLIPRGYSVVRADEIDEEGLITNQIIDHLLQDDLVVADLTGSNPNVFYEVAVRHASNKPIVHLITAGETIPFDVAHMRAVSYALDDPDLLEEAQQELDRKVAAIEDGDGKAGPNPVTVGRDVAILRGSDTPELQEAGDLLAALTEIRDQLRSLERRTPARPGPGQSYTGRPSVSRDSVHSVLRRIVTDSVRSGSELPPMILEYLWLEHRATSKALAASLAASPSTLSRHLKTLETTEMVERVGGEWTLTSPFREYVSQRARKAELRLRPV
jgi:hypothetical protein